MQTFIFQGGKKKSSGLFPLAQLEITYYLRPDSELGKLTEARTLASSEMRFDPVKSAIAFFIAQVVKNCLKTNQSDPYLFQFLNESIVRLENATELSLFPQYFLTEFALHLGVEPLVEEGACYFNLLDGEIRCNKKGYELVEEGPEIPLIRDLFLRKSDIHRYPRETRLKALTTLLKYYKVHVHELTTQKLLEVLQEVIS